MTSHYRYQRGDTLVKRTVSHITLTLSVLFLSGAIVFAPDVSADNTSTNIYTVQPESVVRFREVDGLVEAVNESTVSARTSGVVKQIHFDINDFVPAGAVIIELDSTAQVVALDRANAMLKEAQSFLSEAKVQIDRVTQLLQRKAASQAEFDRAKAQYESAQARVATAKAGVEQATLELEYTKISAPYAGLVKTRLVEMGEKVQPGTPLMTGLSLEHLRVLGDIPQRDFNWLAERNEVEVVLLDGSKLVATPVTLYPFADQQSHGVRFRALLNTDGKVLFPGMMVKIRVPLQSEEVVRVPLTSIVRRTELDAVYVQGADNKPKLRMVRLGRSDGERVEIEAGLNVGDKVFQSALDALEALAVASKNN